MAWYANGDWSNAGGQDLPHIIAEIWTGINQRRRVLTKIDRPWLSDAQVASGGFLWALPGTADTYFPTADDIAGDPIHTPKYIEGIQTRLPQLIASSSSTFDHKFAVNANDFLFYTLEENPSSIYLRELKDDVTGSSVIWFDEDPPFVFYRPWWDVVRRMLDRLTRVYVNFLIPEYEDSEGNTPVDLDSEKEYQSRFASTYPAMLSATYSTTQNSRETISLTASDDGFPSEQINFCEVQAHSYCIAQDVGGQSGNVLHDFPYSFVVDRVYMRISHIASSSNLESNIAEPLWDASEIALGGKQIKRGDLLDGNTSMMDVDYTYILPFFIEQAQLIDGLLIEEQIDWSVIPASDAFDGETDSGWSWVSRFWVSRTQFGQTIERASIMRVETNISSELDDQ